MVSVIIAADGITRRQPTAAAILCSRSGWSTMGPLPSTDGSPQGLSRCARGFTPRGTGELTATTRHTRHTPWSDGQRRLPAPTHVSAAFGYADNNAMPWSVVCQVLLNGVSYYDQDWGTSAGNGLVKPTGGVSYTGTFTCNAGDVIDVAVGPGTVSQNGSWTSVSEQITEVPEPGSLLAFGSGLIGLAGISIPPQK